MVTVIFKFPFPFELSNCKVHIGEPCFILDIRLSDFQFIYGTRKEVKFLATDLCNTSDDQY